ncbi:MAG: 2-oxoacid:acceptor oxidoreductase family protein [Thermoplasmata archaeon]|nr:2-oxoacid:acceptor oxidoreductase family protein [Thermoplasmata archaeon]
MDTIEIRLSGFGGQGLMMASVVLGRAASMYESKHVLQRDDKYKREVSGLHVVQTQTYGAGVRGGATRAEVKISTKEISYPEVSVPDVLVLMSEAAYKKYGGQTKPETLVIIDQDTVKSRPEGEYYEIPATVTASELGNKIVANMVMLGAVVAMTKVVELDSLRSAIRDMLPPDIHELNSKALEKGYKLGQSCGARIEVDWG